jgi:molybdopterin-guanine dinucleotide biosynthesis protein A
MTDIARAAVAGGILAGGKSRRMGDDKPLMPLGGRTMIDHVIERLAPQVSEIVINANGDPARYLAQDLPVVADLIGDFAGPLAGVHAVLTWAARRDDAITHVVTAAADTPFFPRDLVSRLVSSARGERSIVMAKSDGNRHPVFSLWPVSLRDDLENWLQQTDTYKVMAWVSRHDFEFCEFPLNSDGSDPFFNANTPEEFATAERLLQISAA